MTPEIEAKLKNLEARHLRHQAMLEDHREAKHQRRAKHRAGWHKRRPLPIILL